MYGIQVCILLMHVSINIVSILCMLCMYMLFMYVSNN